MCVCVCEREREREESVCVCGGGGGGGLKEKRVREGDRLATTKISCQVRLLHHTVDEDMLLTAGSTSPGQLGNG